MNQLIKKYEQYRNTVYDYEVDLHFILNNRLIQCNEEGVRVLDISADSNKIGVEYLGYYFQFTFYLDRKMNIFTVRGHGKTKPYDSKEKALERRKAYEHCMSVIIKVLNVED